MENKWIKIALRGLAAAIVTILLFTIGGWKVDVQYWQAVGVFFGFWLVFLRIGK